MTCIALTLADVFERGVASLGLLVDQHRMALREGAALAILSGQAHAMALIAQRAESESLGGRPIEPIARLDHLAARLEETLDGLVDVETFGRSGQADADAGLGLSTPVAPRRGSSSNPAALRPAHWPSSQSALLGL